MKEPAQRKQRTGVVVSDKMQKTIVVEIATKVQHPLYKKYVRQRVKYKVHDEHDECKIGDLVEIVETRPLSRGKRWRLKRLIERAS